MNFKIAAAVLLAATLLVLLEAPSVRAFTTANVVGEVTLAPCGKVTLEAHAIVRLLEFSGGGVISPIQGVGGCDPKGGFSNFTPECRLKHYVKVTLQPGKIQLDSDSSGFTTGCVSLLGLVAGSVISIIGDSTTGSITLLDSSTNKVLGTGTGSVTIVNPCPPEFPIC